MKSGSFTKYIEGGAPKGGEGSEIVGNYNLLNPLSIHTIFIHIISIDQYLIIYPGLVPLQDPVSSLGYIDKLSLLFGLHEQVFQLFFHSFILSNLSSSNLLSIYIYKK